MAQSGFMPSACTTTSHVTYHQSRSPAGGVASGRVVGTPAPHPCRHQLAPPYLGHHGRISDSRRTRLHATGFEPHAPGAAQLASMATVMTSTLASALYWWFVVVPSERASLSKQKRRGSVKEYLEEIEQDPSRGTERWFYTEWRDKLQKRKQLNAWGEADVKKPPTDVSAQASTSASTTAPAAESVGQAVTDSNQPSTTSQPTVTQAGSGGPSDMDARSNPDLLQPSFETPTPQFLSLDNPIVFTVVALAVLVGIAALVHGP